MSDQLAAIVERKGGRTVDIGDFRITVDDRLKLDHMVYNDILARRGLEAMQKGMDEAQYVSAFGSTQDEFNKAKKHATVALQHIVPDQFKTMAETDIHIRMEDLATRMDEAISQIDDPADAVRAMDVLRRQQKDLVEYLKAVGLTSNENADKFAQAMQVIGHCIQFISQLHNESKAVQVECPHCSRTFMADVSGTVGKKVRKWHETVKSYPIMDAEFSDI